MILLAHVGPVWSQVGPKLITNLAPSRSMLAEVIQRWPKLAPSCLQDGLKLAHVGSCWPQIGSMQACQGVHEGSASKAWIPQDFHEGSASGVAKACKGVHEGSASKAWVFKISTKAMPQAFRRLIVPSGSSIFFL